MQDINFILAQKAMVGICVHTQCLKEVSFSLRRVQGLFDCWTNEHRNACVGLNSRSFVCEEKQDNRGDSAQCFNL